MITSAAYAEGIINYRQVHPSLQQTAVIIIMHSEL